MVFAVFFINLKNVNNLTLINWIKNMSMRSTKDLKDIVTGARAKSKMNGIRG